MLGARPVTMLAWESFGEGWVTDVEKQLKLKDVTVLKAPYGEIPDLSKVDPATDVVFTWNGTTSGVRVPNARLDRGRPQGPDHLRRDLGRLRAAARFRQARCRHLLLAEGAGRRSRARHADPVAARGRTARKLQAGLAAAEDFPPHQGRQADQRRVRRRNHQHAVHALRRGLHRHAAMGEVGRRTEGADRACRCQCANRQRLGCAHALDRESRRRSEDRARTRRSV